MDASVQFAQSKGAVKTVQSNGNRLLNLSIRPWGAGRSTSRKSRPARVETSSQPALSRNLARGVLAGLAGTAVMTAFQKVGEMPITGRADSYAPADFAAKVLPPQPGGRRDQLNYTTHFALGTMWGAAYGAVAHTGLRGSRAVGPCSPPSTPAMSCSTRPSALPAAAGRSAR